jgi:transcriptional antiterminator RfaH
MTEHERKATKSADDDPLDPPAWYCLRTGPKQEQLAMNMLRVEAGLECYCPKIRFKKARRQGVMWVTEALFPCYVFVRMDYAVSWRHALSLSGVRSIVSFGEQPAILSDSIISDLRNLFQDKEFIQIEPEIRVGKEIRIVQGAYKGWRALVTKVLPSRRRVAILMEILGSDREVEIDTSLILPDLPHPLASEDGT